MTTNKPSNLNPRYFSLVHPKKKKKKTKDQIVMILLRKEDREMGGEKGT